MTQITHDAELPFAVASNLSVHARFRYEDDAIAFRDAHYPMSGDVVDTTPKPVLPELPGLYQDARYSSGIEHAETFRLSKSYGWVNALNNNPLSESRMADLQIAYKDGKLARLVREVSE